MNCHIKVCGLTRAEDAHKALELGASFLGLIFAESPRRISVPEAKVLAAGLKDSLNEKSATLVGVFVDSHQKEIEGVLAQVPLGAVQLHGKESPTFVKEIKRAHPELLILKAIELDQNGFSLDPFRYEDCDYFLFDSKGPRVGGPKEPTGKSSARPLVAWQKLMALPLPAKPFFIAGGLQQSNVAEIVTQLKPFGVDVSSGVESQPGVKDPAKLQMFTKTVATASARRQG